MIMTNELGLMFIGHILFENHFLLTNRLLKKRSLNNFDQFRHDEENKFMYVQSYQSLKIRSVTCQP